MPKLLGEMITSELVSFMDDMWATWHGLSLKDEDGPSDMRRVWYLICATQRQIYLKIRGDG